MKKILILTALFVSMMSAVAFCQQKQSSHVVSKPDTTLTLTQPKLSLFARVKRSVRNFFVSSDTVQKVSWPLCMQPTGYFEQQALANRVGARNIANIVKTNVDDPYMYYYYGIPIHN